MGTTTFNAMVIDAIGEIMNISIGASATAVSTMLGTTTNITTPIVSIETRSQFSFKDLEPAIGVEISYVKGLSGRNVMMFSRDDVRVIVGMMMGQEIPPEEFEMDELNKSAICEVMNMMMGSSATALAEFLGYPVDISTPVSFEIKNANDFKDKYFPNDETQVVVRFSLEIGDKLSSEFLNIMGTDLAKKLLEPYADSLGTGTGGEQAAPAEAVAESAPSDAAAEAVTQPKPAAQPQATVQQESAAQPQATVQPESAAQPQPAAQPAANAPAADQSISDDEAKRQYESMTKGQRPLSQGETDALLASLKQQAATEPAAQPQAAVQPQAAAQPSGQQGFYTEPAGQTAQPLPQGYAPQAAAQPQPAAQPQGGCAQPPYGGQPYYAPQPDPALAQILQTMQQSQAQMVQMMQQMNEDRKEERRQAEAWEKERREEEKRAEETARADEEIAKQRQKPNVYRSLHSPEYADVPAGEEINDENREMLMKVPLEISVEIGRTTKPIKDILELTQGSLVVLDKMAGEQADLYVNGECIARGDVVVVEDNFGIRITEILNKDIYREEI